MKYIDISGVVILKTMIIMHGGCIFVYFIIIITIDVSFTFFPLGVLGFWGDRKSVV